MSLFWGFWLVVAVAAQQPPAEPQSTSHGKIRPKTVSQELRWLGPEILHGAATCPARKQRLR